VFEIRFAERSTSAAGLKSPQFEVTVVDPKTRIPFWWMAETIQRANRASTTEKNYDQPMANLIDDIKKLAGQSNSAPDSKK
jgi:hypothetical protein